MNVIKTYLLDNHKHKVIGSVNIENIDILDQIFFCLITCFRIWGSQWAKPQTKCYSTWWQIGPSQSIYGSGYGA
jgi:hypothetical protein